MPRVLLVDDKPDVLEYVGEILEHSLQHEFLTATNTEDARKLLLTNEFDCVLLDLRIPACRRGGNARLQNGVSLFHQIIKIKGVGKVAIVIMTSHAAEALHFVNDFQNDGLTFYLAKDLWDGARTVEVAVNEALAALAARKGTTGDARLAGGASVKEAGVASAPPAVPGVHDVSARTPAPADPRWADIINDPITLDGFMAKFCEHRSKENRMCRKQALLAASRHGTVMMPPLALPHKHGQAKKYFTHDLLSAWRGFLDEGVDLPQLLQKIGD